MPFDLGWSEVHSKSFLLDTVKTQFKATRDQKKHPGYGFKQAFTTQDGKIFVAYVGLVNKPIKSCLDLTVEFCFQSDDDLNELIRSDRKMSATVQYWLIGNKKANDGRYYIHQKCKVYAGQPIEKTVTLSQNSTFFISNYVSIQAMIDKAWLANDQYTNFVVELRLELKCKDDSLAFPVGEPIDSPNVLIDDFNQILTSKMHCDIVLIVGDEKIPANKCILASRCPYFAALFQSEMIETKNGEVPVKDVDLPVFKEVMKYIYTGKVDDKADVDWSELLLAADKYQLDRLKKVCELRVANRLTKDNVVNAINLALLIDAKILKSAAVEFLNKNCDK